MLHRVEHLLRAEFPSLAHAGHEKRGPGHALHAAGDHALGVTGADRLSCQGDSLQARAADFIDRQCRRRCAAVLAAARLAGREPAPARPVTRSP